jgi:hypothetical protein
MTDIQYKVKSLQSQVDGFKSGEKYKKMRAEFKSQLAEKDRETKQLKQALADAHSQTATMRKYWLQGVADLEQEHAREMRKMAHGKRAAEERALAAERLVDELRDKLKEKTKEFYRVGTELEEEKGKNKKLQAQLNRDYENSSLPSSMKPKRKKIANNREKTDRKPGGQPGHEGHGRKKQTPTRVIMIPAPEKYANSPNYKPTGRMVTKQMVNISIMISCDEYTTAEFRNTSTGQRVHAEFPPGVVNDVNYGGSVKAFAFLLNNYCCVSIDKTRGFLSELTDGKLAISKGMINGLSEEFSEKTQAEQKKAFSDLLLSPVMGTDATGARVGGKSAHVFVCATPDTPDKVMYFAREHKGHEGVQGTPVEDYQGIMVHDHDKTFYNYATWHQECLVHVLRYLKASMDNEFGLQWNTQMRELMREMIHHRNSLDPDEDIEPGMAADFEARYSQILDLAKTEYEYEPPSAYYRDGYNLYVRLDEYKENHLLFLHDRRVPTDNNLCERLLRIFKRKQKQVMAFRSFESLDFLCQSMSVLASLSSQNQNLYKSVAAIFG